MISCKRATELISKSCEEPLTALEKASLAVHLFVCEFCEQFRKQLTTIRTTLNKGSTSAPGETLEGPPTPSCDYSTERAERIKAALRRSLSEESEHGRSPNEKE